MDVADILNNDGYLLPLQAWSDAWRRTLTSIDVSGFWEGRGNEREMTRLLKKTKWPDNLRNLELLGKHIKVGAFKETVDHSHKEDIRSITRTIVDPKRSGKDLY
jgi:phage terminase small subunit